MSRASTRIASLIVFSALLAAYAKAQNEGQPGLLTLDPNGQVSGSLNGEPLEQVLRAFTEATGVGFVVTGPATETITLELKPMAPDEAIRTILGERSSIRIYGVPEGELAEVWILRGVARPLNDLIATRYRPSTPVPRSDTFDTLKKQALTDKDPAARVRAVEALVEADEAKAKPALVQALLNDKEPTVRQAALESLLWYDDEAPQQALMQAALQDESAEIRRFAIEEAFLDEAEDNRNARRVLSQALGDADVEIRLAAVEGLANVAGYDEQDRATRQALNRAAHDADERVRLAALEGLEESEMRVELEQIANEDESATIRSAAREALERLSTP